MRPDVRPFDGVRFDPARVALSDALCPPYDVISSDLARALRRRARNAIHLELPEGDGPRRYRRAARLWRRWRAEGVLRRDARPCLYVCEESFRFRGRALRRLGFLAALGTGPASASAVVPHERTLPKPKADRLRLLEAVGVNISPIFGLFADEGGRAGRALRRAATGRPSAEGSIFGVRYRLWALPDGPLARVLAGAARRRPILIADGHHRFEVGKAYGRRHAARAARAVLAYLCPEQDRGLLVLPTHRVVSRGAAGAEALAALCRLRPRASLAGLLRSVERSSNPYVFGVYDGRRFVLAEPRSPGGCRSGLCVEWLGRRWLAQAPPGRIRYTHDAEEARRWAKRDGGWAVFVKPLKVPQIRKAVEAVGVLPPKSTYFFPKVATGLAFKSLVDEP